MGPSQSTRHHDGRQQSKPKQRPQQEKHTVVVMRSEKHGALEFFFCKRLNDATFCLCSLEQVAVHPRLTTQVTGGCV